MRIAAFVEMLVLLLVPVVPALITRGDRLLVTEERVGKESESRTSVFACSLLPHTSYRGVRCGDVTHPGGRTPGARRGGLAWG